MAAGDCTNAIQAFNATLTIDPAYSQAQINKMNSLLALKETSDAMAIFVKL